MKARIADHTDPKTLNRWEEWCRNNPSAHFFQSPRFARLLNGSGVYDSGLLVAETGDGVWQGVLFYILFHEYGRTFRRLTSRAVIYGGPVFSPALSTEERQATAGALLPLLNNNLKKRCLYIQFRNFSDSSELETVFKSHGYKFSDRLNLLKSITDPEKAFAGLSPSRRRQVRQSRDNGLIVREAQTMEEVDAFYALLKAFYRDKVRKPLPTLELFSHFFLQGTDSAQQSPGKILVAEYQGRVVGGMLAPFTPEGRIFEWYVCGLDKEYARQGVYPSVALTWAAMEAGHAAGCHTFDFLGMGIPGKPYGVRDFKARFGGEWVNYGRWIRVNSPLLYNLAEIGYNVMRLVRRV